MFKALVDGCEPKRATKYSACVDLFASEDCTIGAGETVKVLLGVCIDLQSAEHYLEATEEEENFYTMSIDMEKYLQYQIEDLLKYNYIQLNICDELSEKGLLANVKNVSLDFKDELYIMINSPLFPYKRKGGYISQNGNVYIKKGDKVAQAILKEHKNYLLNIGVE